jgi:hypothetical protein
MEDEYNYELARKDCEYRLMTIDQQTAIKMACQQREYESKLLKDNQKP